MILRSLIASHCAMDDSQLPSVQIGQTTAIIGRIAADGGVDDLSRTQVAEAAACTRVLRVAAFIVGVDYVAGDGAAADGR